MGLPVIAKSAVCDVRIASCVEGIVVAEVDNVCVTIWRGEVTPSRFALQRQGWEAIVARHGPRAAILCVIEPQVPPPASDLRRASTAMIAEYDQTLCCKVAVIEAQGFMAAVTRSVLSGMTFLKRPVSREAHLSSVAEAADWMAPYIHFAPPALAEAVETVRRQLAPIPRMNSSPAKLRRSRAPRADF